ncbi:MAG: hypothetical protein ACFFG0_03995 [Candidatus Thorarchaeota archaeon]
MDIEIGDYVIVNKTGAYGKVIILEGCPARKAYVDLVPGADGNYIYLRMEVDNKIETLALNCYNIKELTKRRIKNEKVF